MTREISNSDDIIDSRDVIARIEELESIEGIEEKIDNLEDDDDAKELVALRELAGEAEGYAPDWTYGATLIRESYWTEYVQELLEDCGELPRDLPGYIVIDWDATTRNIKVDYTEVDFDGVTYLVR
jgi:hypothetical protein